jgi:hypothetical protein
VKFLNRTSAEAEFVLSALIGVVIAAVLSRIPGLGLSFTTMLAILLSIDVIRYIANKAGWSGPFGSRRDKRD